MAVVALDSSVIVASMLSWHEHHELSLAAVSKVLSDEDRVVVPRHALVEAYAVMTRLPSPHRVSPADARTMLSGTFQGRCHLPQLGEAKTWVLLEQVAALGIAGGRTYDAQIAAAARDAGASTLLTWNLKHLRRVAPEGLSVESPGASLG